MAAPSNAPKKETLLDVQGLTCPLPVLKANKALRGMPAGARLTVLATDAASVVDFQAFCRETGHSLVSFSESAGVYRFTLRKRDEAAVKGGG
ncbi:sulfurtransferase TusA family protein [Roseomonas sp. GCM10028921]